MRNWPGRVRTKANRLQVDLLAGGGGNELQQLNYSDPQVGPELLMIAFTLNRSRAPNTKAGSRADQGQPWQQANRKGERRNWFVWCSQGAIKNFRIFFIAATVVLLAAAPPALSAKWCGTGGKSWRGIASNFIPEYYPPVGHTGCPARLAPIWKACRSHDQCYWNRNWGKEQCDDKFPKEVLSACGDLVEPYRILGMPIIVPADCHRLQAKCVAIAAVYNGTMRLAQGQSYREAQQEAQAAVDLIVTEIGDDVFRSKQPLIHDRIAHHCTELAVETYCPITSVAKLVLLELHASMGR